MRKILSVLLAFLCVTASAQTPVWNSNTLRFTSDTVAALEDMTGALPAVTSTNNATILFPFGNGFQFRYGLRSYSQLSISAYGFVRLGAVVNSFSTSTQDSVIVPFYAINSFSSIRYKIIGSAPYRVYVVEWSGNLSQTGQTIRVQLHLSETNGKIRFVYSGSNAYGISGNPYQIALRGMVEGNRQLANVDVRTALAPLASYGSAPIDNREAITAGQRFTFQPDTTRPATPTILFQNIQPGCMNVLPQYASTNASAAVLEKELWASGYGTLALLPAGQSYYDTTLWADTTYRYRSWSTNGFVNSDTTVQTNHMPVAQINGLKRIPGDYASINALLADAACKQLGPELVIELQSNYSFAVEGGTVLFTGRLRSPALRSVIIRPAAGANLTLQGPASGNMFRIDSMTHVIIDGRPGGSGSAVGMTIHQNNTNPLFIYGNTADSCEIRYCLFDWGHADAGITIRLARLNLNAEYAFSANNIFIHHNRFAPANAANYCYIFAEGSISDWGKNLRIEDNEFSRYRHNAFELSNMIAPVIRNNRFFQATDVSNGAREGMLVKNCSGTVLFEGNRIGGAAAALGTGSYVTGNETIAKFAANENVVLRGNEFANIRSNFGSLTVVLIEGAATVVSNRFGSADSVNSIYGQADLSVIVARYGAGSRIDSNFMSGLGARLILTMCGLYGQGNNQSQIAYNDFGGSDRYNQNTAGSVLTGIQVSLGATVAIHHNQLRGLQGGTGATTGIDFDAGSTNAIDATVSRADINDNEVHNIQGKSTVVGIEVFASTKRPTTVNHNNIYSLRGTDRNFTGSVFTAGIRLWQPATTNQPSDTVLIEVAGNNVHSLDHLYTTGFSSPYQVHGINLASRYRMRVVNNVIRLGITPTGAISDSLDAQITALRVTGMSKEVAHNSIYVGGRGGTGIDIGSMANDTLPDPPAYITSNIIQIDKYARVAADPANSYYVFMKASPSVGTVVSNNNLWYSATGTDVAARLASWRATCHCDSATIIGNPLFAAPTADSAHVDLHLQPGSVADGAGTAPFSPVPYDRDSLLRASYSPVDMGAYANTPCSPGTPVTVTLNGPTDIGRCAGTPVTLSATVSGTPTSLIWQRNFNDIAGATGTTYSTAQAGSYRLVARYTCGIASSATVLVRDTTFATPTVTRSPATGVLCSGTPVTLTASSTACTSCTYTWSNGQTGNPITITNSTSSLSVTTTQGNCVATSNPLTYNFTQTPAAPTITPAGPVCVNTMLNAGTSSEWYRDGILVTSSNTASLFVVQAGSYTVKAVTNTCKSGFSNAVVANASVAPSITIANTGCATGTVAFTATTVNGGATPAIQWYVNGALQATTGATFTLSNATNGMQVYAKLTSTASCASSVSVNSATTTLNCVTTAVVNIDGLEYVDVTPNPARDVVRVRLKLNVGRKVSFRLVDAAGRTVRTLPERLLSGTTTTQVPVQDLAPGVYHLVVRANGQEGSVKIIVTH